ncbi:MAG TPA: glycosyltransferase [Verrucomicrobiae bacterium]|nr:glycosyltransferase [Verrucomicrobiae bacterium]
MDKVTFIIPVKPGGESRALQRLLQEDFSPFRVEILVAEGKNPSRQRNLAAAAAAGDFLYFLDDDSLPSPGFLRRALSHFADPRVAAAGGPSITPADDTLLQRCFGLVFTSPIGGGGMRNRYRKFGSVRVVADNELILCNMAFRRRVFLDLGGFDELLYPNEENELMERVRLEGWKLVHDPELAVMRSQRRTLRAFVRQLFSYGRGRGEQTLITRRINPVTLAPPLFLLYLLAVPGLPAVYSLPLLCYLATVGIFSGFAAAAGNLPAAVVLLPVLFPIFHLSYGAGMLAGLSGVTLRRKRGMTWEVNIRRERALSPQT